MVCRGSYRCWPQVAALVIVAAGSLTCHDSMAPKSSTSSQEAFLAVEPKHATITTHTPIHFRLTLRDAEGQAVLNPAGPPPKWAIEDSTIASVSDSGTISRLRPGLTHILATWGGVSGFAVLQVLPAVAHIAVGPDSADDYYDRPFHLTAIPRDSLNDTLSGRLTAWRSSDTAIAKVSDSGTVLVKGTGVVQVSATIEGLTNSATVFALYDHVAVIAISTIDGANAMSVGQTLPLTVNLQDPSGYDASGFRVTWTSLDTTRARVSSTGVVTGVALGPASIAAVAGGKADTFLVRVDPPVASVAPQPDTLDILGNAHVGLVAVVRDSLGHPLPGHSVTWAVADTTRAALYDPVTLRGQRFGVTAITATSGGKSGGGVAIVDSTLPLTISPTGAVTLTVGGNYDFFVQGPDTASVQIRSTDTTVFTVFPTDTTLYWSGGFLNVNPRPRTPGVAALIASSAGESVVLRVAVIQPPVVNLAVTPQPGVLSSGDTVRFVAYEYGKNALFNYPLTWGVSNSAVVTVDTGGLLTARGPGRAGVFVSAGGKTDTIPVYVRGPSAPVVTALSDSLVAVGDTFSLKGTALGTSMGDTVWIAGRATQLLSVTDTQIVAVVPGASQYGCASTGPVRLRVTVGREFMDTLVSLRVAPTSLPAVGDVLRLAGIAARCTEFPIATGNYLIGLANSDPTPQAFDVELDSAGAEQVAAPPPWPTTFRSTPMPRRFLTAGGPTGNPTGLQRIMPERLRALAQNARLRRRLGLSLDATSPSSDAATQSGAINLMRVPVLDAPSYCTEYTEIQTRTVYTGMHVLVMEDVDAPLAGTMDPALAQMGTEFDNQVFGLLTDLGNPVAKFPGGRFVLLVTPQVNSFGASAFVAACDFYPMASTPSSNQAPVIYLAAPSTPGSDYTDFTPAVWQWVMPAEVVEAAAHLTTFGIRMANSAPPEEVWLDEGIALATVEIWDRQYSGSAWKGGAGYQATLYCEVRPTTPSCSGRPYAMFSIFQLLHDYDVNAPFETPLGPAPSDDPSFIGGAWWFLRSTIDRYAGDEMGFLRALVQEPSLTGTANLSARAGQPIGILLADWTISAYGANDPSYSALPPAYTISSWNSHDIFAGMHDDFPQDFPEFFPLSLVDLSGMRSLLSGGTEITGFGVGGGFNDALGFTSSGGGVPSPSLLLTLVRVR